MTMTSYDPRKMRAIVDKLPVLDPADDPEAFMAEYDDDRSTTEKGMYGAASFVINPCTNGTFTVKLKKRSVTNKRFGILSATHKQFTVLLVDKNTLTQSAFAPSATVKEDPGIGGGTEDGDKEWVFNIAEWHMNHDGRKVFVPL